MAACKTGDELYASQQGMERAEAAILSILSDEAAQVVLPARQIL